MRTTTARSALAARPALAGLVVGLALTGCGGQALVGQNAIDPVTEQVSAEEARELAPEVHEESTHSSESAGGH